MTILRQAPAMIRGLAAIEEIAGTPHAMPAVWIDCDTGDFYEAATSKDSEWVYISRIAQERGEVITFAVPRECIAVMARQLGGRLD